MIIELEKILWQSNLVEDIARVLYLSAVIALFVLNGGVGVLRLEIFES